MATRGGVVSKSATKALRAGIGREEKRGISTFLLARSGSIGAFVADLDKRRRRVPFGRDVEGRTETMTNTPAIGRGPRERAPTREHVT